MLVNSAHTRQAHTQGRGQWRHTSGSASAYQPIFTIDGRTVVLRFTPNLRLRMRQVTGDDSSSRGVVA